VLILNLRKVGMKHLIGALVISVEQVVFNVLIRLAECGQPLDLLDHVCIEFFDVLTLFGHSICHRRDVVSQHLD
jgi:hypothetical protein